MKKSLKKQYEELVAAAKSYYATVQARRAVVHSSTPMQKMENNTKMGVSITIAELVTVVRTANNLGKHVVLETDRDNLVIQLVDRYPALPLELRF